MTDHHRSSPTSAATALSRVATALLIVSPLAAVAISVPLLWGHAVHVRDLVLAAILYAMTGHGVTIGYPSAVHPPWVHPQTAAQDRPRRRGIDGVQGSVVSWVANHRRHHVHSDKPGDPHSPHSSATRVLGPVRGFLHAHVGWLFANDAAAPERYAADLIRDRDVATISTLFPVWAVVSLALPFAIGWLWSGSLVGGVTAFVWAGLLRMALLHHVTWSVNSICHMYGRRAFPTDDESRNVGLLAAGVVGRVLAQLPPRLPSLRSPRRPALADGLISPNHPHVRDGRLGEQRAVAERTACSGVDAISAAAPTRQ